MYIKRKKEKRYLKYEPLPKVLADLELELLLLLLDDFPAT